MKTFDEWEREPKARPPKDLYSLGVTDIYEIREEAWNARDDDFADLQHQLEPSPCGVEGHRRADWVELGIVAIGDEMYYCSLCRREQEIRREEREPICELFELWRTSSKRITFVDKESSVQWKRIWNSLVDKLTESGDYRALPEREAASRKEAK